jgi:hypothetical protein
VLYRDLFGPVRESAVSFGLNHFLWAVDFAEFYQIKIEFQQQCRVSEGIVVKASSIKVNNAMSTAMFNSIFM